MAINYCVNCGEKLEPGAKACTACGEAVPYPPETSQPKASKDDKRNDTHAPRADDDPFDDDIEEPQVAKQDTAQKPAEDEPEEEDFSTFADFTGFDIMTSHPAVAPAERVIAPPDQTDVMAPIKGMRSASEFRAPENRKSHLSSLVKIAVGIAAVILVIAGVGLLGQPETQQNIQKQIEAVNSSESIEDTPEAEASSSENAASSTSSTSGSSLSVTDSAAIVDDDTAFEILTSTYDGLQAYNDRVYSCLQTYNGTYLLSDRGQREAAAGIAKSLLDEIEGEMKSLDSMNIGRASSLYNDYENVRNLLNDQYQRLAVVVESWDISLSFDTPYEHQSEILEPLTRDIGPSGQNSYLEDFDANYWSSRPVR